MQTHNDRVCRICERTLSTLTRHVATMKHADRVCPTYRRAFVGLSRRRKKRDRLCFSCYNKACPICKRTFLQRVNLATHIRTVHKKRRDHKCPSCSRRFGHVSHLVRHINTVHEQRRDHA